MSGSRVLIVVSLAATLMMIGVGMIVALLPQRVLAFGGSLHDVGFVASVFAVSYLLVQLPIGRLADRLGIKPFLVLGYALCAVSGLVFFFAESPFEIFAGRFVQGVGEAPVWALGPALLALAYPHAAGKVIGLYNAAIHAGLAIGPLLGILLFPRGDSSLPFVLFAALCFSGGIAVLVLLPGAQTAETPRVRQAPRLSDLVRLLAARGPFLTLLGILLYGAGYGVFISLLPAFLALTMGFGSDALGLFFALFYVAISIAQVIVGPLSDRHGRRSFMIAGLVLAALGFASFGALDRPLVYAPLTVASLGLGVFCVASLAYLNESVPAALKASVSGAYYLFWGLGYCLGPLVLGWSGDAEAVGRGYLIFALLLALQAGALTLGLRGPAGRR